MAHLLSVATALGDHRVTAADTIRDLHASLSPRSAARISELVTLSGNEARRLVLPLPALCRLETLEDRNPEYIHHSLRLGERVGRQALKEPTTEPDAVASVIGVSSTGHLIPTLETHLRKRLLPGLVIAYGPGYSCELALIRADGWLSQTMAN